MIPQEDGVPMQRGTVEKEQKAMLPEALFAKGGRGEGKGEGR